jgi:hypothetical protein
MFPEGYRDRAAERRSGAGDAEDDTKMSIGLHNMPPPSDKYVTMRYTSKIFGLFIQKKNSIVADLIEF